MTDHVHIEKDVTRGPADTELMGLSIAIPAKEAVRDDGTPWDRLDWEDAFTHYRPQALQALRLHVGGARFHTEPQMTLDGPHQDPLQGALYVLSVAAWFRPGDLPPDCSAYVARAVERRS